MKIYNFEVMEANGETQEDLEKKKAKIMNTIESAETLLKHTRKQYVEYINILAVFEKELNRLRSILPITMNPEEFFDNAFHKYIPLILHGDFELLYDELRTGNLSSNVINNEFLISFRKKLLNYFK